MARKTKPWDMKVIYHNRRPISAEGQTCASMRFGVVAEIVAEESALGASYVSFEQLIATSDVLSVNCPLTPETRGILDDAAFAKMKDGIYIINTARVSPCLLTLNS